MNTIKHIIEPKRLLLCWQAPEGVNRKRFIVGELIKSECNYTFRYLLDSGDIKEATVYGFQGYPAFKELNKEYNQGVMESFMRRLPPKSRGDFDKYLHLFRLPTTAQISDFSLLGYTGAKLPTDGFSITNPFDGLTEPCEFLLEVAGFRYFSDIKTKDLNIGDPVSIQQDKDNQVDKNAIKIEYKGKKIGYVNRALTSTFSSWITSKTKIQAVIERVNGHPVRPLVYLFVSVRPKLASKK